VLDSKKPEDIQEFESKSDSDQDFGDEVVLIYNEKDDLYYLYFNNDVFLNYYLNQEKALVSYKKVIKLLSEGKDINWIRTNVFGWKQKQDLDDSFGKFVENDIQKRIDDYLKDLCKRSDGMLTWKDDE